METKNPKVLAQKQFLIPNSPVEFQARIAALEAQVKELKKPKPKKKATTSKKA